MALGQHAVVVEPSRYSGDVGDLAQRLAPVLRVPATKVAGMLERGPITVDADLDEPTARRLLKRLDGLGIPAQMTSNGEVVIESVDDDLDQLMAAVGEALDHGVPVASLEEPSDAGNGWGEVLPGIGEAVSSEALSGNSTSEPEPVDERSASLIAEFEAAARTTEEVERPTASADSASTRSKPTPAPPPKPSPAPPRPQPASPGPRVDGQPKAFDSSLMSAALVPRDDPNRPPHKPTGFDDGTPHLSGLAVGLSILAPGAGQVYNGDDDEALSYGLRFPLILPWIKSVQDARERAEKIDTYWLPRPPEGSFLRAVRYAVLWWVSVAAIVGIVAGLSSWAYTVYTREPVVEITDAEIATALSDAETEVRIARIEAMRALSEAQLAIPPKRFTMNDEERAERLFIIGFRHCEQRNFAVCESIMKKVASLEQSHIRAFRLQAWASAARSGNIGKFPDVGQVPTLSEFETDELSEQLGVPRPRREDPPAPEMAPVAPDAGVDGGPQ